MLNRLRSLPTHPLTLALLLTLPLAIVAWLGWPGVATRLAADTPSYLAWPGFVQYGPGTCYIGARPPLYPILLKLLGTGRILSIFQYLFSLFSWGLLGWVLARRTGLMIALILALAPAVSVWDFIVLTESLALSLMILALAGALLLARGWTRPRFAAFACAIAALGLLHDKSLFLIPFFCLAAALFQTRRRALLLLSLGACVFLAGIHGIKRNNRWQWGMINNVLCKVLPSSAMTRYFVKLGMPLNDEIRQASGKIGRAAILPLQQHQPDFIRWIEHHGHATYYRYSLPRLRTYTAPWGFLNMLTRHTFYKVYSGKDFPQPLLTRLARIIFEYALIPPILGPLLLGVLIAGLYFAGPARETRRLAAIGLILFAATYAQAFIAYHGDNCETERHMLNGLVLYRVVNALALLVALQTVRKAIQSQRRKEPASGPAETGPDEGSPQQALPSTMENGSIQR